MATLRETRDRIRSVNSTKKITKAQEMIATSRITKAQQRVEASQPYATELGHVVSRVAAATSLDHPLLTQRADAKVAAILVVTSDRGQCGGYNHNMFKKADDLAAKLEAEGLEVVRFVTGKKGVGYYKFREIPLAGVWTGFSEEPRWENTHDVRHYMVDGFVAGSNGTTPWQEGVHGEHGAPVRGFDQVHVIYTEFVSMLTQRPRVQRLLPVTPEYKDEEFSTQSLVESSGDLTPDMDFEPDAETLLDALLPQYVSRTLYAIFLEASASESAARRTAMKNATDNANDLVRDLTRQANQARQAQITQEISEIIGGAGALADSGERD